MRASGAAVFLLVTASMGCSPQVSAVRLRAANEFNCPEESITVEDLGADSYRVTGCEVVATYHCLSYGYGSGHVVCAKEEERAAPSESPEVSAGRQAAPVHPPKEVLCSEAFNHVHELASAWLEWHPEREAGPVPSQEEFIGVCHELSMQQQACLVMPWGRTHRASCVKQLDAVDEEKRAQLDGLFLKPAGPAAAR